MAVRHTLLWRQRALRGATAWMGIAEAEQRTASGDLDACDGHNSSSSGNGGGPFFSFTRSPHRLVVRVVSGAQETAFEPLRLHLKPVSEGRKSSRRLHQTIRKLES